LGVEEVEGQPEVFGWPERMPFNHALDNRSPGDHRRALDLERDRPPAVDKLYQQIAPSDIHSGPVEGEAPAASPDEVRGDKLFIDSSLVSR